MSTAILSNKTGRIERPFRNKMYHLGVSVMGPILKMICLCMVVFNCLAFVPTNIQAGMIEPSRTLGNAAEPHGRLTVLSEPSGLEVILDGNSMGQTPIFLIEVQPGPHPLTINNLKTTILVEAGKTLQISLYKGKFIEIPVAATKPAATIKTPKQKPAKAKPSAPPAEQRPADGLTPMERYRLLKHY